MRELKFKVDQKVRIRTGEFRGQEGAVYLTYSPFPKYLVKIEREGFPENRYVYHKFDERDLEAIE